MELEQKLRIAYEKILHLQKYYTMLYNRTDFADLPEEYEPQQVFQYKED